MLKWGGFIFIMHLQEKKKLINCLMVSWDTTFTLWISCRCNHWCPCICPLPSTLAWKRGSPLPSLCNVSPGTDAVSNFFFKMDDKNQSSSFWLIWFSKCDFFLKLQYLKKIFLPVFFYFPLPLYSSIVLTVKL